MYCPNCGSEVDPSWNACPSCGTTLHDDMEDKQPQQPQYQSFSQPYAPSYPSETAPGYYVRPSGGSNKKGIISLVLGIIGFFFGGMILGICNSVWCKRKKSGR